MFFLYLIIGGLALGMSSSGSAGSRGPEPDVEDDGGDPVSAPIIEDGEPEEILPPEPEQILEDIVQDAPLVIEDPGPLDNGGSDAPDLPASAYDIGWAGLSAEEQMIVELINRARLDPASEVERLDEALAAGISSSPVEALAVVETLSDAAEAHSEDMDDRNYFSHTDLDGGRPWDRAVDEGHSTTFVGENIGWIGSTRAPSDIQARAEGHHHNLWDSDGHQQNLMSGNWSEVGIGYDYGSYQGYDGSTFVTELFSDTGQSYLTGVVIDDEDGDAFYDVGEGQGGVQITAYNDEDAYATATWDAGGYSLALPPGTYRVVFEGGELDQPYETDITIGNDNVKLDVIDQDGTTVASLNASAPPAPVEDAMAMLPPLDDADIFIMEDDTDEPDLMLL